ncbi:MAG: RidA family protein [Erysipelotrichaceae bacterium]|nr:RidA family protein [Erysipelotrichaceae bacterium]MBQ4253527.1 RidA family protein [Erysipelotrichaceae bacterium]
MNFAKAIFPDTGSVVGPYSPAIKLSDFVFLSGQLPTDPVTGNIESDDVRQQTHQSMQNVIALLDKLGLETRHIVKTTVYLSDMNNFAAMNEVYASYFDKPYPARSCIQVGALPKGALVEIECIVIDTLPYENQTFQCSGSCCEGGECEGCGE